MRRFAATLLFLAGVLLAPVAHAAGPQWRASWAAPPEPPMPAGVKVPVATP